MVVLRHTACGVVTLKVSKMCAPVKLCCHIAQDNLSKKFLGQILLNMTFATFDTPPYSR